MPGSESTSVLAHEVSEEQWDRVLNVNLKVIDMLSGSYTPDDETEKGKDSQHLAYPKEKNDIFWKC